MFLSVVQTPPICDSPSSTVAVFHPINEILHSPNRQQTDLFDVFKHFEDNSWCNWNARQRRQFLRLIVSKIELTEGAPTPSNAIWRLEMLRRLVGFAERLEDSDDRLDTFPCQNPVDDQQTRDSGQESASLGSDAAENLKHTISDDFILRANSNALCDKMDALQLGLSDVIAHNKALQASLDKTQTRQVELEKIISERDALLAGLERRRQSPNPDFEVLVEMAQKS